MREITTGKKLCRIFKITHGVFHGSQRFDCRRRFVWPLLASQSSGRPQFGKMVKFLKAQKVVILLTGRYAGKKAVIVRNYDEGTSGRKYGHAVVCGLSKEPRKVIKRSSQKVQKRRSSLKTFIKVANYQHIMPTRYTLDVDLKSIVTQEAVENSSKRTEARKEVKKLMEEKFKTGQNKWFFSKLRF